jgi:hypothetical protein
VSGSVAKSESLGTGHLPNSSFRIKVTIQKAILVGPIQNTGRTGIFYRKNSKKRVPFSESLSWNPPTFLQAARQFTMS